MLCALAHLAQPRLSRLVHISLLRHTTSTAMPQDALVPNAIPVAVTSRVIVGQEDSTISLDAVHIQTQNVDLDSNAWILTLPRGAYTAARTVNGTHVLDFSGHVNRTASSLGKMVIPACSTPMDEARLASLTDPLKLASFMRPVVSQALKSYFKVNPSYAPKPPSQACNVEPNEAKITWLAGVDGTLAVHCSPLYPPGPRDYNATRAIIAGEPRGNAQAKDSQWVADRKPLGYLMTNGSINEVLLAREGQVFEGLSSNFFVIIPVVTPTNDAVDPIHCFEVHTAPLTDVLTGTILRLVVEVCGELHVPVHFRHPRLAEAAKWKAAFVTSTSRLVCPLARIDAADTVIVAAANHGLPRDWSIQLDPHNPLLLAIADRVRNKLTEKAEKMLGL